MQSKFPVKPIFLFGCIFQLAISVGDQKMKTLGQKDSIDSTHFDLKKCTTVDILVIRQFENKK